MGRRLLLFVAFLLFTGAVAAVIAPRDIRNTGSGTRSTTAPAAPVTPVVGPAAGPSGQRVTQAIKASTAEPPTARVHVGDLLELRVTVPGPVTLTIAGLNRFASGDRDTPVAFSFIAREPGTFPIRRLEDGAVVARLIAG